MKSVIPTIFAHNKKEFDERFEKLIKVSDNLQIDFMDGKFVPAKSVSLNEVPDLKKYKNKFEAHLMVAEPEKWIDVLKAKGFKKIIFHVEAITDFDIFVKQGLKIWIAINPETDLSELEPYLDKIQGVLFMGIKPGKEHQKFIHSVYLEIEKFKKENPQVKIQVDGGVNLEVARKLILLGVDVVNSGSFISDSDNPKEAFKKLNDLFVSKR